jgi:hypothetical protein
MCIVLAVLMLSSSVIAFADPAPFKSESFDDYPLAGDGHTYVEIAVDNESDLAIPFTARHRACGGRRLLAADEQERRHDDPLHEVPPLHGVTATDSPNS